MILTCHKCKIRRDECQMYHRDKEILCGFCHVEVIYNDNEVQRKHDATFLLIILFIIAAISIVSGFYWGFNRV